MTFIATFLETFLEVSLTRNLTQIFSLNILLSSSAGTAKVLPSSPSLRERLALHDSIPGYYKIALLPIKNNAPNVFYVSLHEHIQKLFGNLPYVDNKGK